ncbi:hypothetical protein IG631_19488 [Alternaria alternata]|nr:hypothetical protein IG631_19488 [Alternaria alternata]
MKRRRGRARKIAVLRLAQSGASVALSLIRSARARTSGRIANCGIHACSRV